MARRRKKSKAAAQAKVRDKDSPMVEKSLPALPPSAIPPGAFSDDRVSPDSDTPTELSPRPSRPTYPRKEPTSRGSPRPARSPERHQDPTSLPGLGLPPAPNYKNNRRSAMFGGPADLNGPDGDTDFHFIPVALDPSPVPPATSRTNTEPVDQRKANNSKDYFARQNTIPEAKGDARSSAASTPHIAFQEKVRRTSSEYEGSTPKEPSRKASKSSKSDKSILSQSQVSPVDDKPSRQNGRPDEFKLQDAPKSKKLSNNRSQVHTAGLDEHPSPMATETPPRNDISGPRPASPSRSGSMDSSGFPADATETRSRDEDKRQVSETTGKSRIGDGETPRPIPRKEVSSSAASRNGMLRYATDMACTD